MSLSSSPNVRVGVVSILSVLCSISCLVACASVEKTVQTLSRSIPVSDAPDSTLPDDVPADFRRSVEWLEAEDHERAYEGFEMFLRQHPTSQWTQVALFHSAQALEGLERWSEARDRYRQVITNTNSAPKIQTLALYRVSFCHEALGHDKEAVAVLHDVLKRSSHLPREMSRTELPARLAAAYARTGNFDRSVDFYRTAEAGITQLQVELKGKPAPLWLSRTLYLMGNTSLRPAIWDDFESHLRPLGRSQIYLLQAAELSSAPWSEKAAKKLIATYGNLWTVIENAPRPSVSDPLIAQRVVQEKQWQRSLLVLESIQELRARALPEGVTMSFEAQEIMRFLDDLEVRIARLFDERPAGEGLTREALMRKSSVRGRVLSPDDSLESQFLKGGREVQRRFEPGEDPNL